MPFIINPATEEVVRNITFDTEKEIQKKYDILKRGQLAWQTVPLKERISKLLKLNDYFLQHADRLASILTRDMGKPIKQAKAEIISNERTIHWLCAHAEQYLSDEEMDKNNLFSYMIRYEPLGVIGNISAWNFPYFIGTNVWVAALLAGNAVLYKPSEYVIETGEEIAKAFYAVGIPPNVFQMVIGDGVVGKLLLDLPLDGYFFTGSSKVGKQIFTQVASRMVPCQVELGGKDPVYVTEDIDHIKQVVAKVADGCFFNTGQSCCSVERLYVHEKIYDQFEKEFVKEVASFKVGDPLNEDVYIGPLSRSEQIKVLENQVADALSKGATLLCGGKRLDRKGFFFAPTVITNVSHDMLIMQEESFGPIIGIMKVRNDEEALSKMADTVYGLTASVYSNNKERAMHILSQLNTGTAYWNCCDSVNPSVPWAGRKQSGFGCTLSYQGLRAFTKHKSYQLKSKVD